MLLHVTSTLPKYFMTRTPIVSVNNNVKLTHTHTHPIHTHINYGTSCSHGKGEAGAAVVHESHLTLLEWLPTP